MHSVLAFVDPDGLERRQTGVSAPHNQAQAIVSALVAEANHGLFRLTVIGDPLTCLTAAFSSLGTASPRTVEGEVYRAPIIAGLLPGQHGRPGDETMHALWSAHHLGLIDLLTETMARTAEAARRTLMRQTLEATKPTIILGMGYSIDLWQEAARYRHERRPTASCRFLTVADIGNVSPMWPRLAPNDPQGAPDIIAASEDDLHRVLAMLPPEDIDQDTDDEIRSRVDVSARRLALVSAAVVRAISSPDTRRLLE